MKHIAIIMDGNRRWEKENNLPKYSGYKRGVKVINETIESMIELGIPYLSVYAFSSENWTRPLKDIANIMKIAIEWLKENREFMCKNKIRCRIIGNRDLLPVGFLKTAEEIEEETKNNSNLNFQIAVSYGARDEMLRAIQRFGNLIRNNATITINEEEFSKFLDTYDTPDPDLLIRTGGEKRLSNYLLWQMAYTEFCFLDKFWPDFTKEDLKEACRKYEQIERRFGRL